jgi:two-component sensor histidine kinase
MSYVTVSPPGAHRPLVSQRERPSIRSSRGRADDEAAEQVKAEHREAEHGEAGRDIDLRQLRHHTKNTLQRILGLIAEAPGLCDTPAGEKIARELEYRIGLSAAISDALFGLTDAPASMAERLRRLAGAMVDMMRDTDQVIRAGVSVRGCCPGFLRETVMRAAHELMGNAVKHGMKGRPSGRIAIRLVSDEDATTLTVVDNGWGFTGKPRSGEGLMLARSFAARHGGSLSLDSEDGTVATLELPH